MAVSYQPPVMPGPTSQPAPAWTPQPAPRKSRAVPILIAALVALVLVVAGLAFYLLRPAPAAPARSAPKQAAVSAHIVPGAAFQVIDETCHTSMPSFDVEDGGHTLIMMVGGGNGMSNDTMTCVFNSLDVPASVREHIGTTRALDGQQTDSWDDFTARWTYHPDDGLQMTIREA